MKKILLSAFAILGFASCKKDQDITPKDQIVNYHVECDYCLVYVEDNTWNYLNELERSKNQHFNISGKWDYQFVNTKLDSLTIKFYVAPYFKQSIKAIVTTNDNRKLVINEYLGGDFNYEKSFTLKLR